LTEDNLAGEDDRGGSQTLSQKTGCLAGDGKKDAENTVNRIVQKDTASDGKMRTGVDGGHNSRHIEKIGVQRHKTE